MSDKDDDKPRLEPNKSPVSVRRAKKLRYLSEYLSKQESRKNCKKVSKILKKCEHERTEDENATLANHGDIVKRISKNKEKRQLNHQRTLETEDNEELLKSKCVKLAKIIQQSKKTVIYTGAGISTAASIPDYRGPQGVWTLLQKGEQLEPQDLSDAEPTLTHMCIQQLHEHGHVKHVVSQNCDGLHLRSGLPRQVLSEVHGNMFIELCHNCRPHREYIRLFDVTENTGVRRHFTGRYCQKCGGKLKDTIVHFGEKGGMKSPYRWKEAVKAANKCDLILCLGSSLKILKKYACLWCMDRVKQKRPNLVIVNLQWTPKDESATLKINGKCDVVMAMVMQYLGYSIPTYSRLEDPIFHLASALEDEEIESTSKKVLETPDSIPRLRSHGLSRTPTPSDSSDSQMSTASSSDSCDLQPDLNHDQLLFNASMTTPGSFSDFQQFVDSSMKHKSLQINRKEECLSKSERICKEAKIAMQKRLPNSKETCLSKSERICNEAKLAMQDRFPTITSTSLSKSERICNQAKIAMQERLVNAKLNEINATCQDLHGQTGTCSTEQKFALNGLLADGVSPSDVTAGLMPTPQYDPLHGGPFDPGPSKHEEKLVYLQMLQSQLDELKKRQKLLKEQKEDHTVIEHQSSNQDVHISELVINQHAYTQSLLTSDTVKMIQQANSSTHSTRPFITCQTSPTIQLPTSSMTKDSLLTSPSQIEHKPCEFVKIEQDIESDAECHKSKISSLESQLKHNLKEQKVLSARLVSMSGSQHQLEEQARQQHKFEQLQLHQQFLLQNQFRQHGDKDSTKIQEEILKWFVFQQQALANQQNSQLLILRQKYRCEVQKIETQIKKMKKSQSGLEKCLGKLKSELKPENCPPSIVALVPNKYLCPDSKPFLSDTPVPLKLDVSPSKKDHSIAALLHGKSPNSSEELSPSIVSVKTEQTHFTCASCQFLKDYGMCRKKRCVKCEALKGQQTVSIHPNLASTHNSTFPSHVPKLQYTLTHSGNIDTEQTDQSLLNHDLSICKSSVVSHSGKEIYLTSSKSSKGKNSTCTLSTANDTENILNPKQYSPRSKPVHVTIPTSSVCTSVSREHVQLSPLDSYASLTADNNVGATNCIDSSDYITIKIERVDDDEVNNEQVTFCLPEENCEGKELNCLDTCDDQMKTVYKAGGIPIRSRSQSEIIDTTVDSDVTLQKTRHNRCHSQSDVGNVVADDTEPGTSTDSVTSQSGADVTDASEDAGKPGRKRKLTRCLSVPGWFGKGLNVKKRRRY